MRERALLLRFTKLKVTLFTENAVKLSMPGLIYVLCRLNDFLIDPSEEILRCGKYNWWINNPRIFVEINKHRVNACLGIYDGNERNIVKGNNMREFLGTDGPLISAIMKRDRLARILTVSV